MATTDHAPDEHERDGSRQAAPDPEDVAADELAARAVAKWRGLVPDELLAAVGAAVGDALAAHPGGRRLSRQAGVDPEVGRSGDVERQRDDDAEDPSDPAALGRRSG